LHANEYITHLTDNGINADDALNSVIFSMASGSNYFFEIAKFRALRMLWANIATQYQPKNEISKTTFITASTSIWNKTLYDPQVNILRSTTETMSAVLGSIDAYSVNSYNSTYALSDDFSRRIAQNIQLILREESYLDKVADPAAGSYYIEYITDAIAKAAWEEFKKVNAKGDFINAITTCYIKEKISATRQERDMDIALRKKTILGTNQYPNFDERMLDKIQTSENDSKTEKYLEIYRGAEAFEELRLQVEIGEKETGKRPNVFLFTIGNLTMRLARASFVKNFFGCAGYNIIDNSGFENIEIGVKQAISLSSDIVVICSSDEEYETFAPEITEKIKKSNPDIKVIVAGYPKELVEKLKIVGVNDFVHVKTNVLEMLNKYNTEFFQGK
jgi:methylmalonyl-CoA mutase